MNYITITNAYSYEKERPHLMKYDCQNLILLHFTYLPYGGVVVQGRQRTTC